MKDDRTPEEQETIWDRTPEEQEAIWAWVQTPWPDGLDVEARTFAVSGGGREEWIPLTVSNERSNLAFLEGFRAAMALVEKPALLPTGTQYHIHAEDSLGVVWTLLIKRVQTNVDHTGVLHVKICTDIPFASRRPPEVAPLMNKPVAPPGELLGRVEVLERAVENLEKWRGVFRGVLEDAVEVTKQGA